MKTAPKNFSSTISFQISRRMRLALWFLEKKVLFAKIQVFCGENAKKNKKIDFDVILDNSLVRITAF